MRTRARKSGRVSAWRLAKSAMGRFQRAVGGAGEIVTLHHGGLAVAKLDELKLVVVGDEAEAVFV